MAKPLLFSSWSSRAQAAKLSHPGQQAFRRSAGRPGHRAFFLATRIEEAPHARVAALVQLHLAAVLAGDVLRAAAYAFWKEARKLRWVCKGVRSVSASAPPVAVNAAGGDGEPAARPE